MPKNVGQIYCSENSLDAFIISGCDLDNKCLEYSEPYATSGLSRHDYFQLYPSLSTKGQIISKGLLVSLNSPKKQTNEFVFTTTTNSFVRFLGEFKDTKKSFKNYLTLHNPVFSKKAVSFAGSFDLHSDI